MYQIDNSTAATSQPASTTAGTAGFFTDGNPATGTPATLVPAEWLNAVMMELANVVTAGGLTLNKAAFNQVLLAIRALGRQSVILADAGAANAYAAVNPTPLVPGTLVHGVRQSVQITNANTGASTYAPDGLAAKPVYGLNLTALQGGELPVAGIANLIYVVNAAINSGNGAWILLECTGGALQIPAATQSNHAVSLVAGDARYAAIAGLASQLFAVAGPTSTQHAVNLGQFAAILSANGYVKIPVIAAGVKYNLILQWGQVNAVPAAGGSNVTFPVAFPNGFLSAVASFVNSGGVSTASAGGWGIPSTTGMTLFNNGNGAASAISYIAIGW